MNHRTLFSRKHLLWLAAVLAIIVLGVLVVRPPAWATPLPAVQRVAHLETASVHIANASLQQADAGVQNSAKGASHLTLQADTPNSDNCIACHTDKKKLKKLAKEPEEVKSEEASGEG